MKLFAELFTQLDQTTKTNVKVDALAQYFSKASNQDRLWTIAILFNRRPKRTVTTTLLREWALEKSNIPQWLFEDSYQVVGDLAEAIALVLPKNDREENQSLSYWIDYIIAMATMEEEEKKDHVFNAWRSLDYEERFIFNKLITGGFRIGVSQKLMVRALSKFTKIEENILAHRLMGNWAPKDATFEKLVLSPNPLDDVSKPYPFNLAYSLETNPQDFGSINDWQVERMWDGIRGQIIVRKEKIFVWSKEEELVTDKFPEFHPLVKMLPDGTVLDGEILPFKGDRLLSFNALQTRFGRKNVTKKILQTTPVILMAYDLLEYFGEDIRHKTILYRREKLEEIIKQHPSGGILCLSDILSFESWEKLAEERDQSRTFFSEGLILKLKDSTYQSGREKGGWWKWKVDPLVIDAVLIYAQQGNGRRASLFTDYTFAVWEGDQLVPFTKANSGLTDKEFQEVNAYVHKNTVERFGPVRSVKPLQVFEIAFEGINQSARHKSGIVLRFPRISRWRKDKPIKEANTLNDLKKLLHVYGISQP